MSKVLYCSECAKEFWTTNYNVCKDCRKKIEKHDKHYFDDMRLKNGKKR